MLWQARASDRIMRVKKQLELNKIASQVCGGGPWDRAEDGRLSPALCCSAA